MEEETMYPYQDSTLSTEERVADLIPRMSLEEKFAQLRLVRFPSKKAKEVPFDLSILEENKHRCGALYNYYTMSAETLNRIQDWFMANNRWFLINGKKRAPGSSGNPFHYVS